MICRDKLPESFVENEGFLRLMKLLCPNYNVPDRKTVSRLVDSYYDILVSKIKAEIKAQDYVSLGGDCWEDCTKQSYLGVTAHYFSKNIDDQVRLRKICLGLMPLSERHTANYLGEKLLEMAGNFDITQNKISCVCSDRGSDVKKAVADTCGSLKQTACVSHDLAHIVPDSIKKVEFVKTILSKVKEISQKIRHSRNCRDELRRLQMQDGVSPGKCLTFLNCIDIRWNSTYYMAARYLDLKKYVYPVLLKGDKKIDPLTVQELDVLKEIVELMAPFEEATNEFSAEKHPTSSIVIPTIKSLNETLIQYNCSTQAGVGFKSTLIAETDNRFSKIEYNQNLAIATILDPRFKYSSVFADPLRQAYRDAKYTINTLLNQQTKQKTKENTEDKSKISSAKKNQYTII